MGWFSKGRSIKAIDKAVRGIAIFQKVFAIFAVALILVGTFLAPTIYAIKNNKELKEEEVVEEKDETIDFLDVNPSDVELDFEIEDLRTLDQKVFRKVDGTYEVAYYPDAVHYLKDGKYVDIDNSLTEIESEISNTDNVFDIKFPKELTARKEVKLTIDDYKINWRLINSYSSNLQKRNMELKSADKTELSKVSSAVYYKNVLPNTDIEYVLMGSKVKENIYVNKYTNDLKLVFEYSVKDLSIINTSSGGLAFINEMGDVIFSLDEMFMIDRDGNISNEVYISYEIKKKDTYIITILPNDEWLEEAIYPVLIDPTISIPRTNPYIEDTYVYQGSANTNYNNQTSVKVGGTSSKEYRSLIKFNIPTYLNNQIITYAHMEFLRTDSALTNFQINVHKNTSTYNSSTVTWNTKPSYDTNLVDFYGYYIINRRMIYDITETVKEWIEDGVSNNGFTLVASELNGTIRDLFSVETTTVSYRPMIRIGYEEAAGLKDYWTYTSQELGDLGTGYVSDYTGNLTFVRNEYELDSEFMSLGLSFYFNHANRALNIGYGNGWKTSFNMKLLYDTNSTRYYLEKPDGNKVYFNRTSSSQEDVYEWSSHIAEDGSRMKLDIEIEGGSYNYIRISMVNHLKYEFDGSGRLYQIYNSKTQHSIWIYYLSGDRISYIKDMVDNRIQFTYNAANLLSKTELKLRQPDSSVYNTVEEKLYTYISLRLSSVTQRYNYQGLETPSFTTGETLYYSFNSTTNALTYAYSGLSRHRINYTYTSNNNKVATITTTDTSLGTAYLDKLMVSYSKGKTVYTNHRGEWISYLFDDYGHTINILDSKGNAAYYKYSTLFSYVNPNDPRNGGEILEANPNYYSVHKLIESSDIMKQNHNYIVNHGFENITGLSPWTKNSGNNGTILQSKTEKMLGEKSLEVKNLTGITYAEQAVNLVRGTYTVTVWIKNNGPTGNARLEVISMFGTEVYTVTKVGEWVKATVYIDLADDTTVYIRLYNSQLNTSSYFDNVELTEGFTDTRYNSLTNHSFENGLSNWTNFGASVVVNGTTGVMNQILGNKSLQIIGKGNTDKKVRQYITDFVTVGETYMVGGWAKANAAPSSIINRINSNRYFGIEVTFELEGDNDYPGGQYITYFLPFNTSTKDWQYQMVTFTVPDHTLNVTIDLRYYGEGTALFDNIQLYHDNITTKYQYDSSGNLINKESPSGTVTSYQYDNNYNVIKVLDGNQTVDLKYNYNYLVEEISFNNVKTTFVYDSSTKQIKETIVGDTTTNGKWFKSSINYTSDKQYISDVTDEFGNTTNYDINSLNGLVRNITAANLNIREFGYNNLGNLINQTETDTKTGNKIIKDFTYDTNQRITGISIDGITYGFTYDNFDRITNIKIAGIDYVTLTYLTEIGTDGIVYQTGRVNTQQYSNGDIYKFIYNSEDRVEKITFNGIVITEYSYDAAGRLTVYKDVKNNDIYFYTYDLSGRLKQVVDQSGNTITYTYDDKGNLNNYSYEVSGNNRAVYYFYDLGSNEYDYTYYNTGTESVYKIYNLVADDSLKRLNDIQTVIDSSLVLAEYYTYQTPNVDRGNAALRIGSVIYKQNGIVYATHIFTYDNMGNITEIAVTGDKLENYQYKYDGFNRLIRENIKVEGYQKTILYEYDNRGNITSIKRYNYSTSSSNPTGTALSETRLFYKSSGWKDQISSINYYTNGTLIDTENYTYDSIGNVTSINTTNNNDFTWDGRSLVGYTDGSNNYEYSYNDQGIRVSKVVNGVKTDYFVDGDRVLVEITKGNKVYYTYDVDGTLLSMNYQDNEYFYIKNLQGDIIKLVDNNGNIVSEYRYDAWGNIIYQYDDGSNISNINPYRYRGYRYDWELELYYLNARYYDSETVRFISADSINYLDPSSNAGLNLYAYCLNNPVMYIDGDGTSPQWWQIAFTVGVAAIAIGAIILTVGAASAGIAPLLFAYYGISASTTFALTMTAASLVSVGIAAFAVADIQSIVTQGNNNYLGFLGHYYEGARTTLYASAMLFPYAAQYAQPGWGRQTSGNEKASQYGPKYGKYTKTSQGGNDVTIYNGRGQAIYRFDSSHSHGGMQPHTHIFQWWKYEGKWRWDGHRGTVVPSIYYIY